MAADALPLQVTVVIPTHNPDPGRLRQVLAGLQRQTLPAGAWELLVVDNASSRPIEFEKLLAPLPASHRIERESHLGLTHARRRGLAAAVAPVCVFVDDDNVLAPDYLAHVVRLFDSHPQLGACGGKSLPEFEREPAAWQREFFPLLALRDYGDKSVVASTVTGGDSQTEYPAAAAPIGAGMALRHAAAKPWLAGSGDTSLSDRRGGELASGGDNDLVLTLLEYGWHVGYFPELSLTHLIPAQRLDTGYLARLNRGIQKSWMQVLTKHRANPWPPVAGWTVPLRQLKAWFTYRAWSSPAARIRWQGACGHFEGRRASERSP